MRSLVAELLVSSALLFFAAGASNTDSSGQGTISPICNGGVFRVRMSAPNISATVGKTSVSRASTYPFLDCFGYRRTYQFDVAATPSYRDHLACQQAADLSAIDLNLYSAATQKKVASVPLDWIYGDAIHSTAFAMPEKVYLNVDVTSPDLPLPTGCSIVLQYSLPTNIYEVTTKFVQEAAPRMHDISPWIAVKGQQQTFRFVRPKSKVLTSGGPKADRFFIASILKGCFGGPTERLDTSTYATYSDVAVPAGYNFSTVTPNEYHSVRGIDPENEVFATWNVTFSNHGEYFLCVMPYSWQPPSAKIKALEVGSVKVFGGNPAYYSIEGRGLTGQLRMNTKYTFKLEGIALDLRPNRDQAKIVDPKKGDCNGAPSHNVEVGTNLGPSDDYGHNVTIATWEVVFKSGGNFWVCYKRYGAAWGRVFPFRGLSNGAQDFASNLTHLANFHDDDTFAPQPISNELSESDDTATAPTTTPLPVATFTPVPGDAVTCIRQSDGFVYDPSNDPGSWVALAIRDPKFYGQPLAKAVADVLCLSLSMIYLSQPYEESVAADQWEIRLQLGCVKECNNAAKLSYIVWLYSDEGATSKSSAAIAARNQLNAAGIQGSASEASRTENLEVEQEPAKEGLSTEVVVLIVIIVILLIVVVVVVVAVVLRNQKANDRRNNWRFPADGQHPAQGDTIGLGPRSAIGTEMGNRSEATDNGADFQQAGAEEWGVEIDPAAKPAR